MDVIGTDRPARPPLTRLPRRVAPVALLAVALVGLVVGTVPDDPDPDALSVLVAASTTTDGLSAQGAVTVALTNAQDRPLRVGALVLSAVGLQQVTAPAAVGVLAPFERREVLLDVVVEDCASLRLPARLRLTEVGDAGPREVPVQQVDDRETGPAFRPCTRGQFRDPYDQPDPPPDLAAP